MDEMDLIRNVLAPLVSAPGADGLRDDVAELRANGRIIATADTIVEGVHFLAEDPLETVAAKLVRVNVSDVIAKGATPSECLLSLVWPRSRPARQIEQLAEGLKANLDLWNCRLVGGDTTSTDGPLVLSLTMTGACASRGPIRRSAAKPGEDIWVSGSIGDGWLGLQVVRSGLAGVEEEDRDWLAAAYRKPNAPPVELAAIVAEHGGGSIDISDGLSGDAGHVAEASGVGMEIEVSRIPLSDAGRRVLEAMDDISIKALLSGGDDYQTLFTAPGEHRDAIAKAAADAGIRLTRIGVCDEDEGVRFIGPDGQRIYPEPGWRHAIGS